MASRTMRAGEIEQLLLGDSRVQDVCVLEQGGQAVAWVVPQRVVAAEELGALLRERLGDGAPPVALVDAIPSRDSGEPDPEALARLTPVTPAALRGLESRLGQSGREAVALAGPRTQAERFDPLDELLPDTLRPKAGAAAGGPAREAAASSTRGSGRPSLLDGGPKRSPPGNPRVLTDVIRRAAEQFSERTLTTIDVEGRRQTLTYAQLWDEALRFLSGLRALGVQQGDRVMLVLERPDDYIRAFWACTLGGMVPAPMASPPSFDASHAGVARVLSVSERLGRPLVLTGAAGASALSALGLRTLAVSTVDRSVRAEPVELTPSSPAILSFTSGSTGKPKGVVLTQDNMLSMYGAMSAGGWYTEEDLGVSWMPLDHVAGVNYIHFTALSAGTSQVLVARDYVLSDILRWMDLLTELRGTVSWAPNFAYGLLADRLERGERRAWDLKSVRVLASAGEALVAETKQRFVQQLLPFGLRPDAICPGWGMAETTSFWTMTRGVRTVQGEPHVNLGPPPAGGMLRIVDDKDQVVPEGTVGHLQVRGATVLSGYLDDPAVNAQSFTQDGWLRTGDLAVVDQGGMAIAGRQKEVLIINGQNVYPHEIESVVELVPGVLPSYAVASPTRVGGTQTDEALVFFVPLPDAPPLGELLRSIREAVARALGITLNYLVPVARHQVPKTELGKRGRSEMRRRFEAGELNAERREADRYLGGAATLPRCLAVSRWVPRAQVPSGRPAPSSPLLVLAEAGLAQALRAHVSGRPVQVLAPDARAGLGEVLGARGPRVEDVLYVAGPVKPSRRLERAALEEEVAPLLHLLRALSAHAAAGPVRLWVAAAAPPEALSPEAAHLLLPGLLWSAAAEVPGLEVRCAWLPPEPETAARFLAGELEGLRSAREVAWREGRRWERAFSPWSAPRIEAPRRLVPGGFYLVTGALGGVGQAWARVLRRGLGARLLLVGRREREAAAEALERELGAEYVSVDLTDAGRLQEAVRQAEARHGRALDGAFHFAGTLDVLPLGEQTPERFAREAAAHVLGAVALAEAFRSRPEALLVLSSSLMGTLGAGLHASYCAASSFVDAFAQRLAAEGRRAVAVSFSAIRETGMARTLSATPPGYRMLEPSQALAAVALAVEAGVPHLLAGVDGLALPWRRAGLGAGVPLAQPHVFLSEETPRPSEKELEGAVLHRVSRLPRRADGTVDREQLAAELQGETEGAPSNPLEEVLVEAFREVLGVSAVGVHSDFFTLGGSSLQATRVVARVNARTGLRLRESALFDNPSAALLAAYVRRTVDPTQLDVSQLSDEQVSLLLQVLQAA